MSFTDETRNELELRDLLAKQRNKNTVVNFYVNRGMDPDEARDMVYSVYKDNLSVNRKSSLGWLIGGGLGTALFTAVWLTTGRLFYIWLPLCAITFLVGLGRFLAASGYEVDEED